MAPSKGEHGTVPTKKVGGVIVNADNDGNEDTGSLAGKSAKAANPKKGESKAEKKQRLADEKQAKKDAQSDLDAGGSSGSN